jgi:hypothetical protein
LKDALEKAQEMGLNLEAESRLKDLFQKCLEQHDSIDKKPTKEV